MSAISKTDAVILRTMKFRESSKIVSLFTQNFGKMSVIVKGAQRAKHGFGTMLEPMSHVALVVYRKEGRDIQTVSQCDVVESFRHIREDLEKLAAGMSVIELVSLVGHEEENGALFHLLVDSLRWIDASEKQSYGYYWHFHLKVMGILGFEPRFDRCAVCSKQIEPGIRSIKFLLGKGSPVCGSCQSSSGPTISLSGRLHRLLEDLHSTPVPETAVPALAAPEMKEEVEGFLWTYLRFHVSGIGTMRSEKVFSQVLAQM